MSLFRNSFAVVVLIPLVAFADIGDCADGNTCFVDEPQYRGQIKLFCTRAPELSEPHGIVARNALRAEVYGTIRVLIDHVDREGRPVAELLRDDGLNLGLNLVRLGLAKVESEGCDDPAYESAQVVAKQAGLGIWKSATVFQCGVKRYCKEMGSCEEAVFYWKHCGRGEFDRDNDGVPCENVCQGFK